MSRIKSKDTTPEMRVRSALHRAGYRFRLHVKDLPGKPDIVLPKYKTVIFVHGCFWHRHPNCPKATTPSTNTEFWNQKFQENIKQDQKVQIELKQLGWKVVVIWECEIKDTTSYLQRLPPVNSIKDQRRNESVSHNGGSFNFLHGNDNDSEVFQTQEKASRT